MMKRFAAVVGALLLATPALAATDASKLAGSWRMSSGKDACSLTLGAKRAKGGWSLDVPKVCVKTFPRLRDAAAWSRASDGSIDLISSSRQRVYRFAKEGGDYVTAPNKDGHQFNLSKGKSESAGKPDKTVATAPKMTGGWTLTSTPGDPKCAFTLKSDAKGAAGSLAMKPGCNAVWKKRGWAKWTLSKKTLTLLDAKGKVLQTFKHADAGAFEGVTARGNPIYFSHD